MPQVPVKNTLFRFNTLRTPQLYTDIKKERICVNHPNPTGEGYYANNISSPAQNAQQQITDLLSRSTEFPAYTSIAELKIEWGENFYQYSNYLAANRQQVFEKKEAYTTISNMFRDNNVSIIQPPSVGAIRVNDDNSKDEPTSTGFILDNRIVIAIWDNLFYQIITNKNPALREQLLQALVANHFASKWGNQEWVNEVAMAVVVIPPAFYAIKNVNALEKTTNNTTPIVYKQQLKNISNTAIANKNIEAYEKATIDFKVAEKDWQKRNQAAYTTAKQAYDISVKQLFAEAPKQTDPKTGKPLPVNVVLPEFEFAPLPQIDGNLLINIQTSSLAAKEGLLSLSSFAEVYDAINRKLNSQTAISFNNMVGSKQVLAVNNNLFEVSGRGSNGVLYSFYAQVLSTYSNMFKVLITLETGYNNPSALDVVYNMSYGGHSGTDGSFNQQSSGTSLILELYPNAGGTYLQGGATSFQLQGIRVVLSNGVKLTFTTTLTVPEGSNYGIMGVDDGDNNGDTGGDDTNNTFIPGYGIRRLGIADYRKVEQSVCCYVPGEVSHIENIMAKEYKERSTRRLRRSEDTTTTEKQTEKEKLTDTTSTDRYEMQQEVSSVLNQDTSVSVNTHAGFKLWNTAFDINANFATHTSQQLSNHQAVTQAKDITERALERVVQKVREERVVKIIEEFEEQNKHGFDNRTGDKHVSGVYRWIDKIYKNQVYNYGKRLMYEFAIPQPAIFHEKAMEGIIANNTANVLQKPIDPRTADTNTLENHKQLTASNYQYWAAIYNAQVDAPPVNSYNIGKSFKFGFTNIDGGIEATSDKDEIKIPEGYAAIKSQITLSAIDDSDDTKSITVAVGNNLYTKWGAGYLTTYTDDQYLAPFSDVIPISYTNFNFWVGNINVNVMVEVLPEHVQQWQIKAFNTIIDAYQKKLDAYNAAVANTVSPSKPSNPGFYRQIENTILRKNCIEYLLPKNYLGQNFYDTANSLDVLKPRLTSTMDDYASKVKFIEQAFEWDIMSYTFYPFYWGNKANWQHAYQQDVDDALFRSFLQAGFARVVVGVRPGFEQAVMYYMSTGKVWNGEQVPVIGDDLYLSIVDELKNQTFYVDETWESRVPTTLTVLQAKSIGLDAQGLPCSCGSDDSIKNSEATLGIHLPKEG